MTTTIHFCCLCCHSKTNCTCRHDSFEHFWAKVAHFWQCIWMCACYVTGIEKWYGQTRASRHGIINVSFIKCQEPHYIWIPWRQKHASRARKSNYTPQFTVGCNYLHMSLIPAYGAKVLKSITDLSNFRSYKLSANLASSTIFHQMKSWYPPFCTHHFATSQVLISCEFILRNQIYFDDWILFMK